MVRVTYFTTNDLKSNSNFLKGISVKGLRRNFFSGGYFSFLGGRMGKKIRKFYIWHFWVGDFCVGWEGGGGLREGERDCRV